MKRFFLFTLVFSFFFAGTAVATEDNVVIERADLPFEDSVEATDLPFED